MSEMSEKQRETAERSIKRSVISYDLINFLSHAVASAETRNRKERSELIEVNNRIKHFRELYPVEENSEEKIRTNDKGDYVIFHSYGTASHEMQRQTIQELYEKYIEILESDRINFKFQFESSFDGL